MEKIHFEGFRHARRLIRADLVDKESDWGFSAADGNKLLGTNGDNWDNYGKFHLVEDTEFEDETKNHWKYPFGKDGKVYRSGVIAVKTRAAQQGFDALVEVSDALLSMIDEEEEDSTDSCKSEKKWTSDSKESVSRVDYMPWPEDGPDGEYMSQSMRKDVNGFLKGRAPATNVGVFPYVLEDGSVQYELRPPEEVFSPESKSTLDGVPVTNDHPPELVTPENAKEYQVGFTGDVREDQYHLSASITITDGEAIIDVQDGKRALSCGYTADMVYKSGVWMGIHYDAIQTNIRYNHLAIVDRGRAGDAARMKMDSMGPVGFQKINNDEGASSMKKIKIDGLAFEVDDNLAKLIENKLDELEQATAKGAELDKVKTDKATASAAADQLKEDNEKLQKEIEDLKKADHSEEVQKAVKERLDLEKVAEKAEVEIKDDMSNDDIKKAVVISVYPSAKEKLDGCEKAYLDARYDGAVEGLENPSSSGAFKGDSLGDEGKKEEKDDKDEFDSDAARKRMIERNRKRSEREE